MEGLLLNVVTLGIDGVNFVRQTLSKLGEGNEAVTKKVVAVAMLAFIAYNSFNTVIISALIGALAVIHGHWSGDRTMQIYKQVEQFLNPNSGLALAALSFFIPTPFAIPVGFMLGSAGATLMRTT